MGGSLSNTQNNETNDTPQMSRWDNWRQEVVQRVNSHQTPQNRQLINERNKRLYESVQKNVSENEKISRYQLFMCYDNFWN